MRSYLQPAKRLASFTATIGLATIVGIVAIPVVIEAAGADRWSALALAQSIALLVGVIVAFGWGTTGPSMVATTARENRPQLYLDSLISRTYLFLLAAPIMVIALVFLYQRFELLISIGALAYLLPFLGGSWYFVGDAKPWRLFFFDSVPQIAGTILGLAAIYYTKSAELFVLSQLLGNLFAVCAGATKILRGRFKLIPDWSFAGVRQRLKNQRHAVITAATGTLYVSLPIIVVSRLLPAAFPAYALADKFLRYAIMVFAPVLQFLQGWIPEGRAGRDKSRMKKSVVFASIVGGLGSAGIVLLGPSLADFLSQSAIHIGFGLSVPIGIVFFSISVSQVIGLACLVPLGQAKALAASTLAGAACGAPLIMLAALFGGVETVAWAVVVSEIVVTVYQLKVLLRCWAQPMTGAVERA